MKDLPKEERKKTGKEKSLKERCNVLLDLVNSTQKVYNSDITDYQKSYLETVIGAAIWYLPKVDGLWDGAISVEALRSFYSSRKENNPKLSEDHIYPRKYSAQQLLTGAWHENDYTNDVEGLIRYFVEVAGRYRYVTPTENKRLIQFQRTGKFTTPEKAYDDAKIKLVDNVSIYDIGLVKNKNKKTIRRLLETANEHP